MRRLIVLTGLEDLERTPWWPILVDTPGIEAILVCRQHRMVTMRSALRSIRRNLRKHGVLFLPWRIGHAVFGRVRPAKRLWLAPTSQVRVEHIETLDLHSPEVLDAVRHFAPDLGVSIGAPILRRQLFALPALGTINVHSGKIPEFRGAPPAFWELYTGATEIGATVHWMDDGLDTGPIIRQATAPIYLYDSLERVEARAEELGAGVLRHALADIASGAAAALPQPAGGRTYRQPTVRQRLTLGGRTLWRRLSRRVLSTRSMGRLAMSVGLLAIVRPLRDLARTLRGRHPVRVFTFHRVTDLCRDGMTVSPAVFLRQIAYIQRFHTVVSLDDALGLLVQGARLRRPVAVITFDDGYRSVFEGARPALQERQATACCFLCTDFVATDRRFAHDASHSAREHLDVMDWREVAALQTDGWTMGGHTANHVRLSECDAVTQRQELERSLSVLRERLGCERVALAYPFGGPRDITPQAVDIAMQCGYVAVFSDFDGDNATGADLRSLGRWELGGDHDPIAWRAKIHGLDPEQMLLSPRAPTAGSAYQDVRTNGVKVH